MASGLYLTLLVGPVLPVPVPQIVLDALASVTVQSNTSGPSGFDLNFTLSNKSPLHTLFLLGAGTTPLLRVIVVVTINGTPQVMMDGVMTSTSVTPAGNNQSTLTVRGEDLTKVMDSGLLDLSGLPYPAMPAEARVALIIAKYAMFGMIPVVIPRFFPDIPLPTDRIPAQKGTDLAYVKQLAKDAGYTFYVDPGPLPGSNTAYWGPEIKVGPPQPALNVDMDAQTNVDSISFDFKTGDAALPIVFIQNSLTKIPIPIPIPNINPLQPPLGVTGVLPTRVTVLRETAKLSPMEAISRGLAAGAGTADSVTATGSLDVLRYGRLLKARQLVGVRGTGQAFDGLYYVSGVKSTMKRGALKQSFTLTRNGLISITPTVPA